MKMYNEIQLTKSKMDLNIRKITNHPPSYVMSNFEIDNINKILYNLKLFFVCLCASSD